MSGKYAPDETYYRQLGEWIAYLRFMAGRPIRFANCSYCDSGHQICHDQDGDHHMVDGKRRYHIEPGL